MVTKKSYTSGHSYYWNVQVLVNTGTFLVYQYCLKKWYLRSLERASIIQKHMILERENCLYIAQYSCTRIWDSKYLFPFRTCDNTPHNKPIFKLNEEMCTLMVKTGGGGTQLWVGYGCATRSFYHHPITKPEKTQICDLCLNHLFLPIGKLKEKNLSKNMHFAKTRPISKPIFK